MEGSRLVLFHDHLASFLLSGPAKNRRRIRHTRRLEFERAHYQFFHCVTTGSAAVALPFLPIINCWARPKTKAHRRKGCRICLCASNRSLDRTLAASTLAQPFSEDATNAEPPASLKPEKLRELERFNIKSVSPRVFIAPARGC